MTALMTALVTALAASTAAAQDAGGAAGGVPPERAGPAPRPALEAGTAGPRPIAAAPLYEGGVRKNRGISIPTNLRLRPERRLSVGYTASNSYLNPGFLVCASGACELQYETDHTGNLLFVDMTQPFLAGWELGLGTGTYRMGDTTSWSPLHRLARDGALQNFHEQVLGENSLPALSDAPDGRQVFSLTDFDGRRLTLLPGHDYALPLRIDLTRYVELKTTARSSMAINAGLHLSHPLEGDPDTARGAAAFARGMDLGLSLNFVRALAVTPNVSSTWHLQVARFRSDVRVVNPGSPLNADDDTRSQYALTYGLRFNSTFGGSAPCSFGMSQVSTSAQYDREGRWTWDPLVFEGGNNHRGALAGANDYGILSFGCEHRELLYQLALVEDVGGFSQFLSDDGAGTSYDPDFAISLSVSWSPGAGAFEGSAR